MDCSSVTLNNILASCEQSVGGIKRILIANRASVTPTAPDSTSGIIKTITLASTEKFKQWTFRKGTGNYTSTVSVDEAIGNSSCTTECSLQFSKAEAEKRLAIQSAINADAVVIIEDSYGQYVYLGYDYPVHITNAVMQSGTATSDLSGFTLTFTDNSVELPYFVDASIIADLL